MAIAYYFFIFERKSGNKYVSKQGVEVEIKLPKEIEYFVAMKV